MSQLDLGFERNKHVARETLGAGAVLLRGYAIAEEVALLDAVRRVAEVSPFRHLITPGGRRMSVAMTNCGPLGWVSDRHGYRYDALDPERAQPWPAMPAALSRLATGAAAEAGYRSFEPDACLVNRYQPGTRLSLHQDADERDFDQPIVSVSLGIPAVFLFGGLVRNQRPERVRLCHGDVVVWGGADRLRYHGVLPLAPAYHPLVGELRINLTFRKAG